MIYSMITLFHHCGSHSLLPMKSDRSGETADHRDARAAIAKHDAFIRKCVDGFARKYRGLACEHDIDDIRQEIYIKILEGALRSYRGESPVEGFLFRMIRNACYDHLRRIRSHREKTEQYDEGAEAGPSRAGFERELEEREALDFVRAEAKKLPAKQALIFTMIALDGMKQEDVARALNLRQSTVSEHYAKAKKLMRSAAKKRYPDMEFA